MPLDKILTLKNVVAFLLLVLLVLFMGQITDVLVMVFAAYVITCAMNPSIKKLQKYMPRGLGVTLLLLFIIIIVLGVLIPLFVLTVDQISSAIKVLPNYIDNFENMLKSKVFGISLLQLINLDAIGANSADILGNILTNSIEAGKIFASSIAGVFIVAIMIFYLANDEDHVKKSIVALVPVEHKKRCGEIVDVISERVGGYVLATILTMGFVGVFAFIFLSLIGNDHATLISFLAFILDIIPAIGPTITVLAGTFASLDNGILVMVLTVVILLLAQWLENQLVRPLIYGKFMDMHPLLIIVSILIGAKFFGIWGAILGPAIASVVCVLVDELYIKPNSK